ncbi:hypothetical protein H5410_042576 [Solanum commersonii]|uniref:Neprosin PEP catalytic domain-containing protein n=1 Tax=Solanum commersonii TaxID=4109 RepID=A0A9J5XYZ6_SOLCO|nr:hypothetical protein H5410_042576 [Solanum commersonii]
MNITRMHLRVVQLLIAIMIFLNYNEVEGLSKKEDEEFEKQLKILNKPPIKTIKTEYGDIYDCVDFYQQPAFDHPLLKVKIHAHHPQMKPSFSLTKRDNLESSTSNNSSGIGLKDGGCPMGTVPIRRTTKEDLIREKRVNRFNASYARGIYHFALGQTTDDQNNMFTGASMISSIYSPKVLPNQWSASVVKLQNGGDQIQAGWRVDPVLYGDTRARFFSLFKVSCLLPILFSIQLIRNSFTILLITQSGTTQCFNTRCPGFVIMNNNIPLDKVFSPTSSLNNIFVDTFLIQKDLITGRWWLIYSKDLTKIGYWPPELFKTLKGFASRAAWGGEIFSSGPTFPPMGSGSFNQSPDSNKDAYCREISVLTSAGNVNDAKLQILNDAPELYIVLNRPVTSEKFGPTVFFGGPGTNK